VIEARFDDLTPGNEHSFALVQPVGIIEAHQPGEVAGALEAADSAAARGLWVAGFASYEAAPGLNRSLEVRARPANDPFGRLPLLWFAMFEERIDEPLLERQGGPPPTADSSWKPSIDRVTYDAAIASVREHIAAGDTYQINFTLRLHAQVRGDERDFYRDLCFAQRGAYAAYVNTGRYRVLSASPELFFRMDGDILTTRPMKGTIARGRWPEEDAAASERLQLSSKDRAENAMIVDLLRNDMGRIAEAGSVHVERMFEAERYETVWQLTSTIVARLPSAAGVVEVFRALFPSGSVTGAPKVRSMQLIAELEDSPRGIYTGAVGFLAPQGAAGPRAAFNVAIRTVVLDTATGLTEYGVGGGITYDSRAQAEFDEVLAKARVLMERRPAFELLETVHFDPADGFRDLPEHLERLRASAAYFGFRFEEADAEAALEAASGPEPVRVRLTLARSGALAATSSPLPSPAEGQVQVALSLEDPVDPTDVMLFHKTTRREPYERRRAAHPEAEDVLLVNARGEVTESTIANLAVKLDGHWFTPPLDCGLLPGIGRTVALREGRVEERRITIDQLRAAEELALVSTVRGWRPAALVG
jgi:para-aminobenzoate synthetase / 4-amino-4-deoxychorismate lyase